MPISIEATVEPFVFDFSLELLGVWTARKPLRDGSASANGSLVAERIGQILRGGLFEVTTMIEINKK